MYETGWLQSPPSGPQLVRTGWNAEDVGGMAGRFQGRPTYARVPGRRDVSLKAEENLRKLVKLRSIR